MGRIQCLEEGDHEAGVAAVSSGLPLFVLRIDAGLVQLGRADVDGIVAAGFAIVAMVIFSLRSLASGAVASRTCGRCFTGGTV